MNSKWLYSVGFLFGFTHNPIEFTTQYVNISICLEITFIYI